ncbi:hypothetical protein SpCBS45565_g04945 [Spizellomyces sp. 'palustris']|nr:hypothetical protein SpCBS45565_g04945 [Spizellomyces sp. 'palustris']
MGSAENTDLTAPFMGGVRKRSARDAFGTDPRWDDPRGGDNFRSYNPSAQASAVQPSPFVLAHGGVPFSTQRLAHRSLPQISYQQRPDHFVFSSYPAHQSHVYVPQYPSHAPYSSFRAASGPGEGVAAAAEGEVPPNATSKVIPEVGEVEVNRSVKGLRHFSRCVADKVQLKGTTTYNEVADELVEEFTVQARDTNTKFDHKNIRRRVYDALNVLMAMDIIEKDRKEIRWTGLPAEGSFRRELDVLQRRNAELRALNEAETRSVNERIRKQRLLKGLIHRNIQRKDAEVTSSSIGLTGASFTTIPLPEHCLPLPFLILSSCRDAEVKVEANGDKSQCCISFSNPFDMLEDMEVIAMVVGQQQTAEGNEAILESAFTAFKEQPALTEHPALDNGLMGIGQHSQQPIHQGRSFGATAAATVGAGGMGRGASPLTLPLPTPSSAYGTPVGSRPGSPSCFQYPAPEELLGMVGLTKSRKVGE